MKIDFSPYNHIQSKFFQTAKIVGTSASQGPKGNGTASVLDEPVPKSPSAKKIAGNLFKLEFDDPQIREFQAEVRRQKAAKFNTEYYENFYNKTNDELLAFAQDSNYLKNLQTIDNERALPTELKNSDFELLQFGEDVFAQMELEIYAALSAYTSNRMKTGEYGSNTACELSSAYICDRLEDAASLYAYYVDRAQRTMQGETLAQAMEKIDRVFGEMISRAASEHALGFGQDAEGIYSSLIEHFEQATDRYTELISNFDFELNEDTAWARENSYYVSQKMRQYVEASHLDKSVQAPYSANDIKAMTMFQIFNQSHYLSGIAGNLANEENLGIQLGQIGLYIELIAGHYNVSHSAKEQMKSVFQQRVAEEIEKMNEEIQRAQKDSPPKTIYPYDKQFGYQPVEEKAVWDTIETMLTAFAFDDLEQGLHSVAKQITEKAQAKAFSQWETGTLQARYTYLLDRNYPVAYSLSDPFRLNLLLQNLGQQTISPINGNYDVSL